MRYSEKLKTKILEILHTKARFPPAGSSCLYLNLNNKIGIKLYKTKKIRNKSLSNQKKLNKIGLAPDVGDKFEIPFLLYFDVRENKKYKIETATHEWLFYYGYITQHAGKVDSRKDCKEIMKFLERLESLGYCSIDYENGWNLGMINNRIVCIDTDPESLLRN